MEEEVTVPISVAIRKVTRALSLDPGDAQNWLWDEWRRGRLRVYEADGTPRTPPTTPPKVPSAEDFPGLPFIQDGIDAMLAALRPETIAEQRARQARDDLTRWSLRDLDRRLGGGSDRPALGRPKKIDPLALIELGAWLHGEGLPDGLAPVERKLAELIEARGGGMSDSTVRLWARKVVDAHRRAVEAEK
jgi:hypothetical protein